MSGGQVLGVAPLPTAMRWAIYAVLACFIAAFWLTVLVTIQAVRHGRATPAPRSTPPSGSVTVYAPSGLPMIAWDATDRRLTVSEHATRDTLICIRGRCDLAEGWQK